jgi:hypothetical protein
MTGQKLIKMIFNFRLSECQQELLEVVRWNDDDATTHDLLRLRITDLTQPNFFKSDVRLRAFQNWIMAGWKSNKTWCGRCAKNETANS